MSDLGSVHCWRQRSKGSSCSPSESSHILWMMRILNWKRKEGCACGGGAKMWVKVHGIKDGTAFTTSTHSLNV